MNGGSSRQYSYILIRSYAMIYVINFLWWWIGNGATAHEYDHSYIGEKWAVGLMVTHQFLIGFIHGDVTYWYVQEQQINFFFFYMRQFHMPTWLKVGGLKEKKLQQRFWLSASVVRQNIPQLKGYEGRSTCKLNQTIILKLQVRKEWCLFVRKNCRVTELAKEHTFLIEF